MSNIDKVRVGSTTYDIADSTSRSNIGDLTRLNTSDKSSLVGAINEVYSDADCLNNIANDIYVYEEMTINASSNGWRLNESDGLCSSNVAYKLIKYTVTEGELIKIVCDDRFQFQNSASVPSSGTSNRIGITYGTFDSVIVVPNGATCLIISSPTNGSVAKCYSKRIDVDATLTQIGKPADAYAVGNIIGTQVYNNIVTPIFSQLSCANTSENVISDVVSVESGKTYFGYALINISNLSGYTTGYLRLRMLDSLTFDLSDKIAGNNTQLLQNGDIELYGSFTPSSNGTVKAMLYSNNSATNYSYNATVEKLYLFELEDDVTTDDVLSIIQENDYADPLVQAQLKNDIVSIDALDDDLKSELGLLSDDTIIDCWGDSLTQGAGSTNYPYPTKLQELVGSDYTVNNYGQGSEIAEAIAFRQGGMGAMIEPFTASTSYVTVDAMKSVNGISLGTLNYSGLYLGNNIVSIDGVNYFYRRVDADSCKLARISGSSNPTYTRPMLVQAEGEGQNHILVVCIGQNGWVNDDAYTLADIIQTMIDYNNCDKFIVVGRPTGTLSTRATEERVLASKFGNHFVNAREYISAYALTDNSLTPTGEDETAMANGAIPPSVKYDATHLNDYGYISMANCIYQRGVSLGYWD